MAEAHYLEKELSDLIQRDPAIWAFIQQASLDGVWYWDLENPEHEWMSPEFWRLFGYSPETKQHLASEWQDMIFPEDLETAKSNLAKHLENPEHPYDQVVRYRRRDGGTTWVRCRGLAIRNDDGKPVRLLGAHNDLTHVKEHETAVQESAALLESITDTATSGIVGLSKTGQVVWINSAARHMLGGVVDGVPFAWPADIHFVDNEDFHPLDGAADPYTRAVQGKTLHGEVSIMTRAGERDPRYVRVSSSRVEGTGSPVHSVMVLDDVSIQEKNRQQVERKSRLDALGQLTGGIAHDFNNLLATIQYAIQLAEGDELSEKSAMYLGTAKKAVQRGSDLTQRLLAFAKRQPSEIRSQNVSDVMLDFQKLATPVIEETIALSFDIATDDLWVYCDPGQLENALLNLVLNSRDAILRSGKGSAIEVCVRGVPEVDADATLRREHAGSFIARGMRAEHASDQRSEDNRAYRYVEFAVTDDGPGMSEEVKRRAVDPFFTTKQTNSGTGLGLSMVYGFLQHCDGELRIYSEHGVGTPVRMLLPRGTAFGAREDPVERLPLSTGEGETILIVEDEFSLRSMMEDLIASLGYQAVSAGSALDAMAVLESDDVPDLLITDIVMPGGVGGFELARRARKIRADLPIIYTSGYTGFSEEEMTDVVAPLVQKPCPPAELASLIKQSLIKK